jgi:hypothetical protein
MGGRPRGRFFQYDALAPATMCAPHPTPPTNAAPTRLTGPSTLSLPVGPPEAILPARSPPGTCPGAETPARDPPPYAIMDILECFIGGRNGTVFSIQWGLPDDTGHTIPAGQTTVATKDDRLRQELKLYPGYADAVQRWNEKQRTGPAIAPTATPPSGTSAEGSPAEAPSPATAGATPQTNRPIASYFQPSTNNGPGRGRQGSTTPPARNRRSLSHSPIRHQGSKTEAARATRSRSNSRSSADDDGTWPPAPAPPTRNIYDLTCSQDSLSSMPTPSPEI